MDKINICKECGTENEECYIYCKNCGAPLNAEKAQTERLNNFRHRKKQKNTVFENNSQNPNFSHGAADNFDGNSENPNFSHGASSFYDGVNSNFSHNEENRRTDAYAYAVPENICGVSTEDMAYFVGIKANEIIPKFAKMEAEQTRISWCWPAAVLGFLIGPLGSALWFLYRKMYKAAGLLLIFGAALLCAAELIPEWLVNIGIAQDFVLVSKTGFLQIIRITFCLVTGLFGYHIYLQHAIKKIRGYCAFACDPRYYKIGLSAIGGTSGGMAALGVLAIFAVTAIISVFIKLI